MIVIRFAGPLALAFCLTLPLLAADTAVPAARAADAEPPAAGEAVAGSIQVRGGFARASVTTSGAAYLVIENGGEVADRLLSAASPVAARVELHATSEVDGVMRMQSLPEGIAVPAHGSVTLEPGGMHVMLMGLEAPLVEGEALPLALSFEHAGEVALSVPILGPGAGAGEDADGHSHGNH